MNVFEPLFFGSIKADGLAATDTLIFAGSAIKTSRDGLVGRLGGTLCLHSTANDPDSTSARDFFDARTDFGLDLGESMTCPVYYHHALDRSLKTKKLGTATLTRDEGGVQIAAELDLSDPDALKCFERAERGELGWSSGTAAHLVQRERVETKSGFAHRILHWPLGLDASLTPKPAEPRNLAVSIKSLLDDEDDETDADGIKRGVSGRGGRGGKRSMPAGHWITHNGAHVFTPERAVDSDSVFAAGVTHDLDETGHATLEKAYNRGEIVTAEHLHLALAHAKRLREGGGNISDADAVRQGLALHGLNGTASHAQKFRAAFDAQRNAEDAKINAQVIADRRSAKERFQESGSDIKDYIYEHAGDHADAQHMAAQLGYRSTTWDDGRNVTRRQKQRDAQLRRAGQASALANNRAMHELNAPETGVEAKYSEEQPRDQDGKWTIIAGHRVSIQGRKVKARHIMEAADRYGVSEMGKLALFVAHAQGKIKTDDHLLRAIAHGVHHADGARENAAEIRRGIEKHGVGGSHENRFGGWEGFGAARQGAAAPTGDPYARMVTTDDADYEQLLSAAHDLHRQQADRSGRQPRSREEFANTYAAPLRPGHTFTSTPRLERSMNGENSNESTRERSQSNAMKMRELQMSVLRLGV